MNVKIYLKSKKNDIDAIATFNTDTNEVTVKKGDTVLKNQKIGTIATMVNPSTMDVEYKILFAIHAPSPKVTMKAANLFK